MFVRCTQWKYSSLLTILFAFVIRQSTHSGFAFIAASTKAPHKSALHLFDLLNEGKKALIRNMAGEYDSEAVRSRLNSLINDSPVLFLSFETCPYCIKAKAILDERKAKYTNIDLRKDPDGPAIRAELGNLVGRTSVPAIWIQQQFIGGCNDGGPTNGGIVALQNSNQLDAMLKAAGAI